MRRFLQEFAVCAGNPYSPRPTRRITAMGDEWVNKLYFGDKLDVLRNHLPNERVDLIYLDPPFNLKATYS